MRDQQNQSGNQPSLYSQVTDRIIAELEQGIVPWVQPWGSGEGGAGLGLPRNARTAKAYSGINILLLWDAVIKGGYTSQQWLTFKQALELGGCVRKGEKGWTVFYADSFIPKTRRNGQGRTAATRNRSRFSNATRCSMSSNAMACRNMFCRNLGQTKSANSSPAPRP